MPTQERDINGTGISWRELGIIVPIVGALFWFSLSLGGMQRQIEVNTGIINKFDVSIRDIVAHDAGATAQFAAVHESLTDIKTEQTRIVTELAQRRTEFLLQATFNEYKNGNNNQVDRAIMDIRRLQDQKATVESLSVAVKGISDRIDELSRRLDSLVAKK